MVASEDNRLNTFIIRVSCTLVSVHYPSPTVGLGAPCLVLLINLSTDLGWCQAQGGASYVFADPVGLKIPGDPKCKVFVRSAGEIPSNSLPSFINFRVNR